ncbi:MAG: hypothetical protein QW046_04725 [Candidatus Micrarchaeaceae archaeon]|uniref:hypothetical protein n=1 Tax=Metallosphaera sp. TaxID=2020860 RepID=UPI003176D36B
MKRLKKKQAKGFFTLKMLNRNFISRKGIKGLSPDLPNFVKDPEKEYQRREEIWLNKHPEISKAERKR